MWEAVGGNRIGRRALCVLLCAGAGAGLAACGGGDSGAEDLARQQELATAKREAAQQARQSERVKQLSREVKALKHGEGPQPSHQEPPVAVEGSSRETGKDLGDWPGGSGYSAMLGAFSSEANARSRQREATERGLDAGVLYSSEFSSLRPGYWVVFSGDFESESDAAARASHARELGYSDSYPRFVSP